MCYAHRYQAWDVIDYKGDNALNMRVTKRTTYRISLFQRIFFANSDILKETHSIWIFKWPKKKCLQYESWPVEFYFWQIKRIQ